MATKKRRPTGDVDREVARRQVDAARQSGREGRDRARTTRGRADLEAAFDEGAAEASAEQQPADGEDQAEEQPPGRAARVKAGASKAGTAAAKAGRSSAGYLSRGRWQPTLTPPSRARNTGSLLTGMLLYTAVITYIRYGPEGWTGWLRAKFLNDPMVGRSAVGGPANPLQRRAT